MKIADLKQDHPLIYASAMEHQFMQGLMIEDIESIFSIDFGDTEEGFDVWMDVYNRKFDSWYNFHERLKEGEINQAKAVLRKHGYYVDNLWSIHDVSGSGTDEQKMEVLNSVLPEFEQEINEAIDNEKEEHGIEEIKNISFSCKIYPSNADIHISTENEDLGFMHYSLDGIKEAFEEDKEQFTQEVRAEICDYFAEEIQGAEVNWESLDKVLDQINTRLSQ